MKKLKEIGSKGDTIVEVLLAIAVLSLVLSVSYGLANRNSQTTRQAQERGEAQKLAEEQLELLRGTVSLDNPWGGNICFNDAGNPTTNNNECRDRGPGGLYIINISQSGDANTGITYTAEVTWDNIRGALDDDRLTLAYKLPVTEDIPSTPHTECDDEHDNGPIQDGLIDEDDPDCHTDGNANNDASYDSDINNEDPPLPPDTDDDGIPDPEDDCPDEPASTPDGCPVPTAVQFSVSKTSHTFPSRHLLIAGGIKPTVDIIVSAPSGDVVSNIGSVELSGSHPGSYSIISNNCSNRTLSSGTSCTIRVQFYPPSGGTNNYFGNSGWKRATLRINGGAGSNAVNVNLQGLTYSDRMRPGDQITASDFGPVPFKGGGCYINVEACGITLTGIASNGNLYLGGTYCLWGGWGTPPYPGTGNRFAMQTDGNLVFYGIGGAYRYASWTIGSNRWLQVQSSGNGVYISHGSGGPLIKWIHHGGSCFAW